MSFVRTASAAARSGNAETSSSRSRTARVPCAVVRLRKTSRTVGSIEAPIRSSVSSAWRASAPATPPISA